MVVHNIKQTMKQVESDQIDCYLSHNDVDRHDSYLRATDDVSYARDVVFDLSVHYSLDIRMTMFMVLLLMPPKNQANH